MKAQIKLGRIAGIEIGLHYSWFIIAFLNQLPVVNDGRVKVLISRAGILRLLQTRAELGM